MKNILITGGTGCLGSNLAARLVSDGLNVRILRRSSSDLLTLKDIAVEHRIGDLLDPASLRDAMRGCDTVIHAAALVTFAARRRDEQFAVNVNGTRNVVDACIGEGIKKLVHVSSIAAIGVPDGTSPATEEVAYNWGASPGYKFSKHLAEREVLAGVAKGLPAVIVNPSVIVGERDVNKHGGQLIVEAKRGRVPVYIRGGMNVVYVQDVVRGVIAAAERGRIGERYILCGENLTHKVIFQRTARIVGGFSPFIELPIPLLRLGIRTLEAVSAILGRDPWISADMVAGAGRFNWYDCSKAKRELDYTITPFDEMISAAYQWYRQEGMI
jgi:dihydroflavonol-4-reductase